MVITGSPSSPGPHTALSNTSSVRVLSLAWLSIFSISCKVSKRTRNLTVLVCRLLRAAQENIHRRSQSLPSTLWPGSSSRYAGARKSFQTAQVTATGTLMPASPTIWSGSSTRTPSLMASARVYAKIISSFEKREVVVMVTVLLLCRLRRSAPRLSASRGRASISR